MIVDLVATGKRVGVTANNHKVIGELLEKTASVAQERGIQVVIGQRPGKNDDPHMARGHPPQEPRRGTQTASTTARSTWSVALPGFGRETTWSGASTCSSSTRPARCPWPTLLPPLRAPPTLCCSAIRNSSTSRFRGRTRLGQSVPALAHLLNGEQVIARPPRPLSRRHVAPAPENLCLYVRGVLFRTSARPSRPRFSRPRRGTTVRRSRHPIPLRVARGPFQRLTGGGRRRSRWLCASCSL